MATYKEIQDYVKVNYNTSIKTCWIADMKESHGLSKRNAPNRKNDESKVYPCPNDKKEMITQAFKHFKMVV